ncbi:TetR/AcrR family transcriptional regulator [Bacillus spizizenii]|uniref:TetR/AcrR family transcriptional regulator n=1 Tax=Bacillus subtilis group TaxID=653685 RepID=UPI00165BAB88|nr:MULTISPECIES: TetR/AcrR family transcriptional regulator [Bacillus subtilis group]MCY9086562.1 TetR/AcrR family transcriptional regulator [Bacillus inaquosorum]MEC0724663.1 TetR/AcrR family transcriptional regulator [Bacillus spizizenii]MEC1599845.1 TetR/AcrR family transcriptional regulator [Bacillus spizizenii]MEC1643563.1 TetR/AcrR family transcriptional regulator [Bacillus spizizenii]
MQDSYTDLRVIRTKESIQEALVELMMEKGFETLTVKDITTKAKINRGTFYAHYEDKYDLMTKCQEEIIIGMVDILKQNVPVDTEEIETNSLNIKSFAHIVLMFEFLNENRRFLKALLGSNGDLSFQTKLKDFMWETLFENELVKQENLLVPGQYLSSYISSAFIGVVQQWLDNDCKETPQEMARIVSTITFNGPYYTAGLKK